MKIKSSDLLVKRVWLAISRSLVVTHYSDKPANHLCNSTRSSEVDSVAYANRLQAFARMPRIAEAVPSSTLYRLKWSYVAIRLIA